MLMKKIAISAAATGILLMSAAGAFAYDRSNGGSNFDMTSQSYNTITKTSTFTSNKTVTVTKADVSNFALVHNDVVTVAKTGDNSQMAIGGDAFTSTKPDGYRGHEGSHTSSGGSATGGSANNSIVTGTANASTVLSNVVNTTVVRF